MQRPHPLQVLLTTAAAAVSGLGVGRWLLRQLRCRSGRALYKVIKVPLPPRPHGHVLPEEVASNTILAGASSQGQLPEQQQPQQQQPELLTVYLLPDDAAGCTQALEVLLPQLLPCHVGQPHALTWQQSAGCALGSEAVAHETTTGTSVDAAASGHAAGAAAEAAADVAGAPVVLGLDAEWQPEPVPGQHNRVSVLQLAGPGWCLLLRPSQLAGAGQPAGLPGPLEQLLGAASVVKAGVGIQEDIRRLRTDFGTEVKGAVDVRAVAQLVAPEVVAAHGGSLLALTHALLARQLDKAQQRSAWASARLSKAQLTYAAQDAWAAREVLLALYALAQQASRQPMPPATCCPSAGASRTPTATIFQQQEVRQGPALQQQQEQQEPALQHQLQQQLPLFLAPFLDNFKQKQLLQAIQGRSKQPGGWPFHLPALSHAGNGASNSAVHAVRAVASPDPKLNGSLDGDAASWDGHGSSRSVAGLLGKKPARHALRKTKLYENCRIQAPDGQVLCTCSNKKIRWYMERGLGVIVCEEPLTVRLHFEPRGRGHHDDKYYTSDKLNQCVVCGATTDPTPQQVQHASRAHSRANATPPDVTNNSSCSQQQQQEQQQQQQQPVTEAEPEADHSEGSILTAGPSQRAQRAPATTQLWPLDGMEQATGTVDAAGHQGSARPVRVEDGTEMCEGGVTGTCEEYATEPLNSVGGEGEGTEEGEEGPDATAGDEWSQAEAGPTQSQEAYLRHSIVPHCYRRCFPTHFKSHLSHDIVLLCLDCHQVCSVHDQQRMVWLGQQYNAPLAANNARLKFDQQLGAVRSAARALLNSKVQLPAARREELLARVAAHYQLDPSKALDEGVLRQAAELDPLKPASEWSSHAKRVVSCLHTPADIEAFVRGWRQHFLDVMQPRYLPPHWSVDARVANSAAPPSSPAQPRSGPVKTITAPPKFVQSTGALPSSGDDSAAPPSAASKSAAPAAAALP